MGALAFLLASLAFAYETDQLTFRAAPPADALLVADAAFTSLLDEAIVQANARAGCDASDEELHQRLARRIYRLSAARTWVWSRGLLRAPGFGRYAAWMERELPAHRFADREDIFGSQTIWTSPILTLAGPSSTFRLGDVLLGSDKIDHFLGTGFRYWQWSREGEDPERAMHRGTVTERSLYGLMTSQAFSFSDLRANYDGYLFYDGLLGADSVVRRDDDGCAVRVAGWTWADWVDDGYDEVLEPSVYGRRVQRRLDALLDERGESLCEALQTLGDREISLDVDVPWVEGRHPARFDPFRLAERCADLGVDGDVAEAPELP